MTDKPKPRHGKLKIDAPLEDALRAALEVKPEDKETSTKKRPRKKASP